MIEFVSAHLADVRRLRTLRTLLHVELDLLAFGKAAKAFGLDRGVVYEDVLPAPVGRDETETLRVVEPLHSASRHRLHSPARSSRATCTPKANPGAARCLRSSIQVHASEQFRIAGVGAQAIEAGLDLDHQQAGIALGTSLLQQRKGLVGFAKFPPDSAEMRRGHVLRPGAGLRLARQGE